MEDLNTAITTWSNSNIQSFWGEVASCDHLVQIYENDKTFLNTLEGFVGDGFIKNESVVVIATTQHLNELEYRLRDQGFDIDMLVIKDQYIPLDAEDCMSKFMVNNYPNEEAFKKFLTEAITRAKKNSSKVRAFGEMVAVLWAQGHKAATLELENLWHQFHEKNPFSIFCAYPKSGFKQDSDSCVADICKAHSKVIDGEARPSTEIYYSPTSALSSRSLG